jgi:hypothetical protein
MSPCPKPMSGEKERADSFIIFTQKKMTFAKLLLGSSFRVSSNSIGEFRWKKNENYELVFVENKSLIKI